MTRFRLVLLFWPLLFPTVVFADNPEPKNAKEALQAFNTLIGEWKGTGLPMGKLPQVPRGFWIETQNWSWKFKDEDAWLTVRFVDGQFFRKGELKYLPNKKEYQLTLETTDKKEQTFTGKFKDKKLTLLRDNPPEKENQRLIFHLLHPNRFVYYYNTLPEGRTLWKQVYKVGTTRQGVPFAQGSGQPQCIVSGGLGTMQVMYKGQTYYVCCSGCRDEFEANPEKYVKEFEKKKGK